MARRKTPDNETPEQKVERQLKESVANSFGRSEKVSWKRKMKNLEAMYEKLQPIEEEILSLMAKKQPFIDEMQELRKVMAVECIHPYDYLVVSGDKVMCKFCGAKIRVNDASSEEKNV